MNEIWKPVPGFEGYYEVSNKGNVRSVAREIRTISGVRHYESRPIKPSKMPNGYQAVRLRVEGSLTSCYIQRLVALAFIPNPNNLPEVNHKDEDKTNNLDTNLEWCTRKYNMTYVSDHHVSRKSTYNTGTEIFSIDESGKLVTWPNASRAAESMGVNTGSISRALRGIPQSHEVRGSCFYRTREEAIKDQEALV